MTSRSSRSSRRRAVIAAFSRRSAAPAYIAAVHPPRRPRAVAGLLAVLVLVGAVHLTIGWSPLLKRAGSFWRLNAGAPNASEPYMASGEQPLVRIAAAGDVGTGDGFAAATAVAMDRLEESGEFDALLLLGDNIYPDGDPDLAGSAVFRPFGPVLDGGTELVPALGNHDVSTGDGEPEMRALGMAGRWYVKRFGPVELVVLDSNRADDPDQLVWLEQTLAASDSPWTVVVQHHPPYSAGYHASHAPSRRHLVPLFERFDVDLVLAGHDHDYQRNTPQNGILYVVSGGAATLRPTGRADFTAVSASIHHFVELTAFHDRLELRAVTADGLLLDRTAVGGNNG